MSEISASGLGFALVIIGFIMAFVAMILIAAKAATGSGKTRGGGVLLIGPFPIVFGTDRESVKVLMVLAIVLIVIVFVFMLLPSFLTTR